ncbi:MAG TPA: hypothetical protein VFC10_07375 [Terriglobia bacterium]|jgi:hypothetical protein|nr:hypothetical protein [Terracidiphilus sp.]HZT69554.1 hypothetical protein [Terriglobia bacterium]
MKNWRTTTLGVLTILAALCHAGIALLQGQPVEWSTLFAAATAGIGLIHAADAKGSAK